MINACDKKDCKCITCGYNNSQNNKSFPATYCRPCLTCDKNNYLRSCSRFKKGD